MRPASETSARDGPSGAGAAWWAQPAPEPRTTTTRPRPATAPATLPQPAVAPATMDVGRWRARMYRHFSSWLPRWYAFRVWRRRNVAELPLIIAHRGASAIETENTVGAFARARADGADGVELDVMTCGTGELVVFHDDDLTRLAGRPDRIPDTSFAAL